jgi:thiamine-phosphate diphosphorylase
MLARLQLITDDEVAGSAGFVSTASEVMATHGPRVAVHLRGHGLSGAALHALAQPLVQVADTTGAGFVLNDRVDVALCVGAGGVQVGRRSLPIPAVRSLMRERVRIGYSAHDAKEARQAETDGADFLLLGAVFRTDSHPDRAPGGVGLIRRAAERVEVPVFGIGGITPDRIGAVLEAGAYGVAVLGGVWRAEDPVAAAGRYLEGLS